jgi:[ribosomal protein S18]-alanine N-acetyltransferase
MHPANFSLKIEPMTLADIPASLEVDQAAYGANFSPRNYRDELEHNQLAHYFVLRQVGASSQGEQTSSSPAVIGLGGFWLIAGELHVITISVHPRYRGLGLGEWLLLTLLEDGQKLAAEEATLEVRVSNFVAQALYQKYGFQEVGRRSGYYSNNGEDALILTTPLLQSANYQALLADRKTQLWERLAQIKPFVAD